MTTETWLPLVTLVVGYVGHAVEEWIKGKGIRRREREAREYETNLKICERRVEFQRETILNLQDALSTFIRATGQTHHQDVVAYKERRQWGRQLVGSELSERYRLSVIKVNQLRVRIQDRLLRELVAEVKTESTASVFSKSREASGEAMLRRSTAYDKCNERIGELIRNIDATELNGSGS